MSRVFDACAVALLTFFLGILPNCLGSVKEVLTSRNGDASVAEVIRHRQPLSTSPEVNELMQSDQSLPEDPEVICGDGSINVRITSDNADNLQVLARE